MEASISDLREALDSGRLSSSGLVDFYLKRIEAYDRAGPDFNSLITVDQNAAAEAKRLDEESKDNQSKGPLYGVPVILKDNMNTADIRTTGGALALKDSIPPETVSSPASFGPRERSFSPRPIWANLRSFRPAAVPSAASLTVPTI